MHLQELGSKPCRRKPSGEREDWREKNRSVELRCFTPDGVSPPGTVTLGKGAPRVFSNLSQCSPPESCWPWGKGGAPLLCAPQDLVRLHNLLRKQKWPIVDFFKEAGVGTRKIPGADFIQVIKGVRREQNGSELLPLPYVLACRPRVVSVEEMVAVQQGALSLVLPSEDDSHSLESWRGKGGQGCGEWDVI